MSFILDALKKSEAERQRQSGPTLLELRITQPRRRYPAWALWVGVLLAVNVAVLLYALLRRPAPSEPAIAATAAAPAATSAAPHPAAITRSPAPAVAAGAPGVPGVPASPAAPTTPNVAAVAPLAPAPGAAESAAVEGTAAPASANPADDEPAVPAAAKPSRPVDYSELPSLASLGGDLPALQLNMLDYSALADERFALINMHRVREGDVLPEGPRVLAITRNGVALDYHGEQFMLHSGGSGAAQ
ncbi:MAG TPA: general secretion pathway protein GspB [Steroidobacteraceae bacterium]|nr:general secretion pathway protein GspB [Steroidobacteraceae bacterium]